MEWWLNLKALTAADFKQNYAPSGNRSATEPKARYTPYSIGYYYSNIGGWR